MPYKKFSRKIRQKNPKMSVKGSNWEWNRFFRKLNCCFSLLQICIARYFKLCAVKHEIVGWGRNATILNAKFVKSWISVASRRIFKSAFVPSIASFSSCYFIVLLLLSDDDKLLLWIVDCNFFAHFKKALVFVSNNKSDKLVIQFSLMLFQLFCRHRTFLRWIFLPHFQQFRYKSGYK